MKKGKNQVPKMNNFFFIETKLFEKKKTRNEFYLIEFNLIS